MDGELMTYVPWLLGLAGVVIAVYGITLWRSGALSLAYKEPERPVYFDSHQHPD